MSAWGMAGRVIPISGAASGIGFAIARKLREDGAVPVLIDMDAAKVEATPSC